MFQPSGLHQSMAENGSNEMYVYQDVFYLFYLDSWPDSRLSWFISHCQKEKNWQ